MILQEQKQKTIKTAIRYVHGNCCSTDVRFSVCAASPQHAFHLNHRLTVHLSIGIHTNATGTTVRCVNRAIVTVVVLEIEQSTSYEN